MFIIFMVISDFSFTYYYLLLCSNLNQTAAHGAHTPVTSNMNPFEDSDDDNDTSSKEKPSNNG